MGALLTRAISGSFVVKVVGAGLALGLQIVLARLLGAEEYGIYRYVWSWAILLVLVCTFGFKRGILRLVTKLSPTKQWGELHGLLKYSILFVFLLGSIIGVCMAGVSYSITQWGQSPELYLNLAIGAVLLPIMAVQDVMRNALRALKHVVYADIPTQIIRRVLIALFVGGGYLWLGSVDATFAIVATAASLLAAVLVLCYWLIRALPDQVLGSDAVFQRVKWTRFAFPFLLISGASVIQGRADVIMLGILESSRSVGIYSAAARLTALVGFGLHASNNIVAPLISELHSKNERDRLQKLLAVSSASVLLYTIGVGVFLILSGEYVLHLFGPEFVSGYAILLVVMVGEIIHAAMGPVGYLASMTGDQWYASKALAMGAGINITLNAVLIPTIGIMGAAIATVISKTCWNTIIFVYVYDKLRINPSALAILQYS
jgi:O-antigen/teichoic acid export membrane protein